MKTMGLNAFTIKGTVLLLLVCSLIVIPVQAQTGGDYDLSWYTIDGGGGISKGGSYTLTGTIGQPDAAYSNGGSFELLGGFWVGGALCIVNFDDFARFADQWLENGPSLPADLNSDEVVDFYDLELFVRVWLAHCPHNWPLAISTPICFPRDNPAYADWKALGRPDCWCGTKVTPNWKYQCDGDIDNATQDVVGEYRIYNNDYNLLMSNWKKKITDPTLYPCADIDHKEESLLKYRVYNNDYWRMMSNWRKKDSQLAGNCPRNE